jgi:DNA modification methylase
MAEIDKVITDRFAVYNADCIDVLESMPNESVHLSIYSPPFCGLYQYSSSPRDLSNCQSYDEFFEHYEYVVKEIARVTMPGRMTAIHCMDIPKAGANIGGYIDFPGDIIRLHEKHGFEYLPRICIWKEPLSVRLRTMAKALAHRQIVEDSTQTNAAGADYLLPMRKKGGNPVAVSHPTGIAEYYGERKVPDELLKYKNWTGNQIENRYGHWIWRQYASCMWDDIDVSDVLPFKASRDEDDEKHVHPLQLQVIARAVDLYTNPGEIVFTPFMGVGSEVYQAVVMGRKGVGVELKLSYFRQAIKNIQLAINPPKQADQLSLFA